MNYPMELDISKDRIAGNFKWEVAEMQVWRAETSY